VAHVEAGLRSYDRSMPEEINRLLTDQVSDLLFTHSREADRNLVREGIPQEKIHFVGNVMIDTLVRLIPEAERRWPSLQQEFDLGRYLLVTLHRPVNVDDPKTLAGIMTALEQASAQARVLFPVHPRTRQTLLDEGWASGGGEVRLVEPLGYLDFLALQAHADLVITDSGGVQEETTYLGVPCLTVRPNTERPVTITNGTNRLISNEPAALAAGIRDRVGEVRSTPQPPELWDGRAAERIVGVLRSTS
jgi:UDP-N-acetylglucosamine 2-epimerase (non-hydrolysing)